MEIRVIGTKEECETARTYYASLRENPQTKFVDIRGLYPCRGSTKRFRIYINVEYYDELKEHCNSDPSKETALDLRTINNAHTSAIRRKKA